MELDALDAEALETNLKELLSTERGAQVAFLRHLAEFGRRKLYRKYEYATLWQYCRDALRLSEFQTYHRTNAARVIDRIPIAAEFLGDGRVCLTTLVMLRDMLTVENASQVLATAVGKSRDDILRLIATLRPAPATEGATVRTLPEQRSVAALPLTPPRATDVDRGPPAVVGAPRTPTRDVPALVSTAAGSVVAPLPRRSFDVRPLSEKQSSVHLVVGPEFIELLERARSILSHVIPNRDVAAVVERCLREVVERAAKREDPAALSRRPTPKPHDENDPYITAELARQVHQRDHNRCASPTPNGGVCGSTHRLQIHHIVPAAKGGKTTLDNLRLACQAHNLLYARLDFGDAFIDAKIKARSKMPPAPTDSDSPGSARTAPSPEGPDRSPCEKEDRMHS